MVVMTILGEVIMTSPLGLYYEGPGTYMPIMDIRIQKVYSL